MKIETVAYQINWKKFRKGTVFLYPALMKKKPGRLWIQSPADCEWTYLAK